MSRFPDPTVRIGDYPGRVKLVQSRADFPAPDSSGIINLVDGVAYVVFGTVDLLGSRLNSDGIGTLTGYGPETSWLKSTGLDSGTPLLTATDTVVLTAISLEHATLFDLNGSEGADAVIDWYAVNLRNATTSIGTIANYNNAIFGLLGFLNSGGLTFDGTFGTIAFSDTIFENASGLTSVIIPSTATITRRFRVNSSSFVSLSGETAINFSTSASVPNEGYILNLCNFSGGGTYTTGVTATDNKSRWNGCRGVTNSGNFGQYYMNANETETVISEASTFVKVAGTTTPGANVDRFDTSTTDNRASYTGSLAGYYKVSVVLSYTAGTNDEIRFRIAKNGVTSASSQSLSTSNGNRNESITLQDIVFLEDNDPNDYVEVWVANDSGSGNVTVTDLNLIVERQSD
jgi:hypothetical protein